MVEAYRNQEIALLTQEIGFALNNADYCHAKGQLIAERQYRQRAEELQTKLQKFKGYKMEQITEDVEVRFNEV